MSLPIANSTGLPLLDIKPLVVVWEAFVSLSLLGYGFAGERLFRKRGQPFGITLCTGVTLWIFVGGWLNLFQVASRPVVWGLLFVGLGFFAWEAAQRPTRERWWAGLRSLWGTSLAARVAISIVAAYFVLSFVSHFALFTWNRWDDVQGYMPFAQKAADLGGLQWEPFSERRLESGMGGSIFLSATMLAGAPLPSIDFLEGGFGLVALLLCIRSVAQKCGVTKNQRTVLWYFVGVFTFGRVNLTSVNLSAALSLAVLLLVLEDAAQPAFSTTTAALIGSMLGAAFTLKSSNIPFCFLFLGLTLALYAIRRRSLQPLLTLLVAGATSSALLLPWGIKHLRDEGTVLFPSLGPGFGISAYGFPKGSQIAPAAVSLLAAVPHFLYPAIAGCFALVLLRAVPRLPRIPVLALFCASALAAPLFSYAISAQGIDRYLLPTEDVCALLLVISILAAFGTASRTRWVWPATAFLLLWTGFFVRTAILQGFYRDGGDIALLFARHDYDDCLQQYETLLRPADLAARTAWVQHAQQNIPAGAAFLENIDDAYGFDWRRNPVLIADFPGMSSLPPGFPVDGTPEAARQYLLSKDIHYVMLDRGIFFNTDYAEFRRDPYVHIRASKMLRYPNTPLPNGYAVMQFKVSNRARELMQALATDKTVLYRDERLEVIKLDR